MDKLDIFQSRFGKVDKFGLWDLEITQTDAGTQFTSKSFFSLLVFCLNLESLEHQDMNG